MHVKSKNILEKIMNIYDDLKKNKILLVHHGDFSQDIIMSMLSLTKERLMFMDDKKIVRKRLLNVLIECLQNITRHASREDLKQHYSSILFIGYNDEYYYITTGNVIKSSDVSILKKRIKEVNSLDEEGLNQLYRSIISQGNFSSKGGAGLGLIDMAKRSGEKLTDKFDDIDDNFTFFTLETKIKRIKL
jgi:hypothetical protein